MFVYIQSERAGHDNCVADLWTVGHYDPRGIWIPESDHKSTEEASDRAAALNGKNVDHYSKIREAIARTEDPTEILIELYKLVNEGKEKQKAFQQKRRDQEQAENILKLKALKPHTGVYCRLTEFIGMKLFKIRDGKTHMHVSSPKGKYRIPYIYLQTDPHEKYQVELAKLLTNRL